MADIRLYNVGWGDCLLLYADGWRMLVDCGTRKVPGKMQPWKATKQALIDNIDRGLAAPGKAYAAVTHLHRDHLSMAFLLRNDSLDGLLLPNFFSRQDFSIALFDLLKMPRSNPKRSTAYFMLCKVFKQLKGGARGVPLKRKGHLVFASNSPGAQALPGELSDSIEIVHPVHAIDSSIDESLLNEVESFFDGGRARDARDAVIASLENVVGVEVPDIERYLNRGGSLVQSVEVRVAIDGQTIRDADVVALESSIDDAMLSLSDFSPVSLHVQRLLRNNAHRYALGFATIASSSGFGGLFLDDIEREDFEDVVIPNMPLRARAQLEQGLDYLKAPHHGTENHYSYQLPDAQCVIISNCERPGWGRTGDSYCLNPRKFPSAACTNKDNCSLTVGPGGCGRGNPCGINSPWYCDLG